MLGFLQICAFSLGGDRNARLVFQKRYPGYRDIQCKPFVELLLSWPPRGSVVPHFPRGFIVAIGSFETGTRQ